MWNEYVKSFWLKDGLFLKNWNLLCFKFWLNEPHENHHGFNYNVKHWTKWNSIEKSFIQFHPSTLRQWYYFILFSFFALKFSFPNGLIVCYNLGYGRCLLEKEGVLWIIKLEHKKAKCQVNKNYKFMVHNLKKSIIFLVDIYIIDLKDLNQLRNLSFFLNLIIM
jgi:hypothetical protein